MHTKWNVLAVAVAIAGWFALGTGSAQADTIEVHCVNVTSADSRFSSCEDQHPTIQDAVNHADAGESVLVGAGTYNEQVVITKALLLEGAGASTPPGVTTIMPASVSANTTSLVSTRGIAPIVLVDGEAGIGAVFVTDLTVDGTTAAATFVCGPIFVGIFYRAASGSIEDTHVTGINPPGCPSDGLGIFVQTDKPGRGKANVAILDNVLDNYGKNGITANQAGTSVTVRGNTINGRGQTADAVQNGVQIGFSARGLVTSDIITNHFYIPPDFVACGVLFFKAGGGVGRAKDNTFANNEANVCVVSGAIGVSPNSPFSQ
jgi:hypothetical protein